MTKISACDIVGVRGGETMANALELRYRPAIIRFSFVAVGKKSVYTGMSYTGLEKAVERDQIQVIYISDYHKNSIVKLTHEKIPQFMEWWKNNYNNPEKGVLV